jgi:hypothetical protein
VAGGAATGRCSDLHGRGANMCSCSQAPLCRSLCSQCRGVGGRRRACALRARRAGQFALPTQFAVPALRTSAVDPARTQSVRSGSAAAKLTGTPGRMSSAGALAGGGSGPVNQMWNKIKASERGHVIFCVVGIVGCLMLYGVLQVERSGLGGRWRVLFLAVHGTAERTLRRSPASQERIMTEPFGIGAAAEVFKYSLFLVLCNRLTSCSVAICVLVVSPFEQTAGCGDGEGAPGRREGRGRRARAPPSPRSRRRTARCPSSSPWPRSTPTCSCRSPT